MIHRLMITNAIPSRHNYPAPHIWLNPGYHHAPSSTWTDLAQARIAEARLAAFAPLLTMLFPELQTSAGIIESALITAPQLQASLQTAGGAGNYWIKGDHALPIAGSIKARGGFHEVLEFAETLALQHELIQTGSDRMELASPQAHALFSHYEVAVGSTGNLGLAIGIISAALGFKATVHMSADAKQWKKDRLRNRGVRVVEHSGDYGKAVEAGRLQAKNNPLVYFVDDEQSSSLFYGYSVAAFRLQQQFNDAGVIIDTTHPLFVYLPCGVGGAPSGIAFGLKAIYGDAVHCFFVEPQASACFLTSMANPDKPDISIYDAGLDNHTDADGLAVPRASDLAISAMRPLLSGVITVADNTLFSDLYLAYRDVGIKLEPSAAAGFCGPRMLFTENAGQAYLTQHDLQNSMAHAHHLVWVTGGLLVPEQEFLDFLARGESILTP